MKTAQDYFNEAQEINSDPFEDENEEALLLYKKALELDPSFSEAIMQIGRLCGDYEKAKQHWEHALDLNPNNVDLYLRIGAYYYIEGDDKRAIAIYDRGIKLFPNVSEFYFNRGIAKTNYGVFEELDNYVEMGIDDYSKAIDLDPEMPQYFFMRGEAYLHLNKKDLAISDWVSEGSLGGEQGTDRLIENIE